MSVQPSQRHRVNHEGGLAFEWDQNLQEVNLYVPVPTGVRARQLYVDLKPRHIRLGLQPNPPYLEGRLWGDIKPSESFWTLESGELHIQLAKARQEESWGGALEGRSLNAADQEAEKKRLLLERFQEEHAGFDFSGAEVVGDAPDPQSFLRGDPQQ